MLEAQLVNQIGSIIVDIVNGRSSKRSLSAIWTRHLLFPIYEIWEAHRYCEQAFKL